MPMNTPAIVTDGLTRAYGDRIAVDDLTLSIDEGEIFGFLGHNGAGKTTTVRMLTTLLQPTSGGASVFGVDVVSENLDVRRAIGYVPEQVRMYNALTVRENLRFFGALSGVADVDTRVDRVLRLIGHPEWQHLAMGQLSKGMRQRVGIAQAVLHEPRVLFLDEPTSGLDPEGVRDVRQLVSELNRNLGITVFMNTHQLSEVTKLCTSIGIMKQGRLVMAGPLAEVLDRFPAHWSLEDIFLHADREQEAPA